MRKRSKTLLSFFIQPQNWTDDMHNFHSGALYSS
nr:MAG TPA: hypothetical protein [Caudoviricetes sp.]